MATKKASKAQPFCWWTEDDDGLWLTDCAHTFEFNVGGPVENKQKFCGYCGKSLREVPAEGGR